MSRQGVSRSIGYPNDCFQFIRSAFEQTAIGVRNVVKRGQDFAELQERGLQLWQERDGVGKFVRESMTANQSDFPLDKMVGIEIEPSVTDADQSKRAAAIKHFQALRNGRRASGCIDRVTKSSAAECRFRLRPIQIDCGAAANPGHHLGAIGVEVAKQQLAVMKMRKQQSTEAADRSATDQEMVDGAGEQHEERLREAPPLRQLPA